MIDHSNMHLVQQWISLNIFFFHNVTQPHSESTDHETNLALGEHTNCVEVREKGRIF